MTWPRNVTYRDNGDISITSYHNMEGSRRGHVSSPGMYFMYFSLSYILLIMFFRLPWTMTTANSGVAARGARDAKRLVPQVCFPLLYIVFTLTFYGFLPLTDYQTRPRRPMKARPSQASTSPRRPAQAHDGQHRPTMANDGSRRPLENAVAAGLGGLETRNVSSLRYVLFIYTYYAH